MGVDISEVRLTVNLAPADVKKSGSAFDLAIAPALLVEGPAEPSEGASDEASAEASDSES